MQSKGFGIKINLKFGVSTGVQADELDRSLHAMVAAGELRDDGAPAGRGHLGRRLLPATRALQPQQCAIPFRVYLGFALLDVRAPRVLFNHSSASRASATAVCNPGSVRVCLGFAPLCVNPLMDVGESEKRFRVWDLGSWMNCLDAFQRLVQAQQHALI